MTTKNHISADRLERRKENLARRERRERIWNIVLLVIAGLIVLAVIAIQLSHHL